MKRPVSMGVLSVWQTMRRMENAAGINKERAMMLHVYRLSTSLILVMRQQTPQQQPSPHQALVSPLISHQRQTVTFSPFTGSISTLIIVMDCLLFTIHTLINGPFNPTQRHRLARDIFWTDKVSSISTSPLVTVLFILKAGTASIWRRRCSVEQTEHYDALSDGAYDPWHSTHFIRHETVSRFPWRRGCL